MTIPSLNNLAKAIRTIDGRFKALQQNILQRQDNLDKLLVGREPTESDRLVACAAKIIPFHYVIDIDFDAADTARRPGTVTITQEGYFLMDRLYACWRPTDGAFIGRYQPISSDSPAIANAELVSGGQFANKVDFTWELVEGAAQRGRQDFAVPGAILYRTDDDGYTQKCSDIFMPASVVTLSCTPLYATATAGTFTFVLAGRQLLNVVEGGA